MMLYVVLKMRLDKGGDMIINGQLIIKGVNINDSVQTFTDQIFSLIKDIETRDSNSLKSLIGKRVAIIRTGVGKAMIVGLVDIVDMVIYKNEQEFRSDYKRHMVAEGSEFDIKPGCIKYGYVLSNIEKCNPIYVQPGGRVIRNI